MAMAAGRLATGTMPGGTTPSSPLRTPVLPLRSPSTAPSPLHQSTPPVRVGISGDLGQDPVDSEVVRSPASSKKMCKVASTKSQETSPIVGSKKPCSHASGSLRVSKAAKTISAKVLMTQVQENSKPGGRKTAPIMCRSPGINMMARKKAQSCV